MKIIDEYSTMEVDTAGLGGEEKMYFEPMAQCGSITDGISISIRPVLEGGWVISFKDLEQVYETIKRIRTEREEHE